MNADLSLAAAGFLAGAMNALAGGGSFVTLPALIAAGVPSVLANASSTVALYPAGIASAWTYRSGLRPLEGIALGPMLGLTLVGGVLGSLLLLLTPVQAFDALIPWLLLLAFLALAFGRRAGERLRQKIRLGPKPVLALQFLLGVYGGYFGGAVGIMMMAVWSLFEGSDLKRFNPLRTVLVTAANTVAVVSFVVAGAVQWHPALMMLIGGIGGGVAGAHLGRRLDARLVRAGTLVLTAGMTVAFFWRAAGA
jgi:uncharacterized protein